MMLLLKRPRLSCVKPVQMGSMRLHACLRVATGVNRDPRPGESAGLPPRQSSNVRLG